MVKLAKYLKPYAIVLLLSIALLFVQAICELNLPNYMSNIINVGIQQGGVESAAPDAVKQSTFDQLTMGFSENDKKLLNNSYTLMEAGSDNNLVKDYPAFATENMYVLNDIEDKSPIETLFGKAAYIGMNMQNGMSQTDAMAATETMDESTLKQAGASMVKMLYTELDVNMEGLQVGYIAVIGLQMLVVTLIGAVATIFVGYFASRIAGGVSRNIRHDLFKKVESFSGNEFDKFSTSSLITRTTNDITQIQQLLLMGIRMIFYSPIIAIGGIIMAIRKGPSISWIIVVSCVVLIGIILTMFSIAMPKFKVVQKLIDRLNLVSRENLSGIMAVRAFGNQEFEKNRFDKVNKELTDVNTFINRVMIVMMPAIMLLMNLSSLLIVWVGANKISASEMQVGDMMAFIQYAMQIIMSFIMMSMMFIMVPRASVSASRIAEVLETESSIKDLSIAKEFIPKVKGMVEFRNVSFKYSGADEYVLHNITFTAKPGETTAFIGSTGSGKSTLINLVPRFYDVTEGQIMVSGVDIKDVKQFDLHDQIGFVPQKGVLHSGTIATNLRYGKQDATDEEIKKAAEIAQASDFIEKLDEKYESPISEGGTNVSGGQKQRLSIARALVKKPPIYIFDDSFSALDFKTDRMLRKALKENTSDSTILLVAQRVSTIIDAEQIIVLNDGEVVGIGTHRELLKDCPTYYEIASSQLSKEELA